MDERLRVSVGIFVVLALLTTAILWRVLPTVFFAITVAYVLYPIRRALVDRGVNRRIAAGIATSVGFAIVLALVAPLAWAIYSRHDLILAYIRALPRSIDLELFEFSVSYDVASLFPAARETLTNAAVDLAQAAPVIAMKLFLLVFLIYAFLLRPDSADKALKRTVPVEYHDIVKRFHRRVRQTLYAIYVVQAATAFATFLVALVVFVAMGYEGAFVLAVFAGILQFIPIIGPSVVIVLLAAGDVVAGAVPRAALLLAVGLFFIGFLPDAVIRPKLAPLTAGIPASLYFIGFAGGVFSLGLVGLIAGPLVVVLFAESVELMAENNHNGEQANLLD